MAPGLSNTTAAFRAGEGCTDTDNNGADFTANVPSPRNGSTAAHSCTTAADSAPTVTGTSPANSGTAQKADNIVITFSEPVTVADGWYSISCGTSGTHTAVVTDTDPVYTLNPDTDFVSGETCTVTVDHTKVKDDDTDDATADYMLADYVFSFTIAAGCGDTYTFIYDIQGTGASSPLTGQTVTTEGVVVGDFQVGGKNGYYIQEPLSDGDPATSDGVFVYNTAVAVSVGDRVRVKGVISEWATGTGGTLTELTPTSPASSNVLLCSTGNTVAPTEVTLPVTAVTDFEKYESMLVTFPQSLIISEYFNFDRYGEIVLTSTRHMTPTALVEPGAPAQAEAAAYLLDRITLDDGRTTQNPDPAIHPNGAAFNMSNLFRGGGTVSNVTGILDFYQSLYRVQPTMGAIYADANPRTAAPEVAAADLKVASFNVLNYFVTLDAGASAWICGPDGIQECRGADDAEEFTRQRAKILAALSTIDADVFGLMEIENDSPVSGNDAVANLVAGLNDIKGAGTYAYIQTGAIGGDAIKQAILYKPASVTPVGGYKLLTSAVDARFIDTANRPALAQVFEDNQTGVQFVVAVNHLKSKGSACTGDPDLGDGQGNCNLTRTAAAQALVDWLANPTYFPDVEKALIIGDLNSYDKEDPIDAIKLGTDDTADTADDYLDMIFEKRGEYAYGYVFDGQTGYLDHALANLAMAENIVDVNFWHINADEPDLIDYDTSFKLPAQDALYAPDAYRSSDHDPVIITFSFSGDFFVTQDFGPWGASWPGAINLGWKWNDDFDIDTIASIEVGMLDAGGNLIVKYSADEEQVAWQKANSYITPGGQESAPFYQWYNGTLIKEGRDLDWTVAFGSAFSGWNPALGFVRVVNLDGIVDYKTVPYVAAPVYADDIFEITDFGLWGQVWPGALSLGWGYSAPFDTDTIASIEVGMVDSDRDVIVRYTADAEQVAWQKANGYITETKLSSAPFYQEYHGMPIQEGRDLDWTVIFGPAFDGWNPAWAYVRVITTTGEVDYDEILYTGGIPGETPVISSTDLEGPYVTGTQQEFHVTLDNSERGYAYSNVLALFELDNLTLADIASFQYLESQDGQWHDLSLTETETGVAGAFGPASGFPIGVPYNATSSFRVTFNTPGTYPAKITLYDVAAEPDVPLDIYTADVLVVAPFAVSEVGLVQSTDLSTWAPVDGNLADGYLLNLDTAVAYYYLDADAVTSNRPLADGSYPFYLTGNPGAEFFAYWANRGVVDGATGWQGLMWQIINGNAPMFFLKVEGTNYSLIDGLQGEPNPLRINGGYYPGEYTFSGILEDELGFEDPIDVMFTMNDIPVAQEQSVSLDEDTPTLVTLGAVDIFPGSLTFTVVTQPEHGTLSGTGAALTYTPAADYNGSDSFTFKASDGMAESAVVTVTLTINPVNDAPVAVDDTFNTPEDTELVVPAPGVLANDTDADGETLSVVSVVTEPAHGVLALNADGSFTYMPEENFFGSDTFTYKVADGTGLFDEAVVTIQVGGVNDWPVANDDAYETVAGVTLDIVAPGVLANDVQLDPNESVTLDVLVQPAHGTLTLNNDGSFTYVPEPGFMGVDTFEYQLNSTVMLQGEFSDTAIVTITVNPSARLFLPLIMR